MKATCKEILKWFHNIQNTGKCSFCNSLKLYLFHLVKWMSHSVTTFLSIKHKLIFIHGHTHMCKFKQPKSWNSGSIQIRYYMKADIVIKRHKFYLIIKFMQFTYYKRQSDKRSHTWTYLHEGSWEMRCIL